MELKALDVWSQVKIFAFQSHLYGIERNIGAEGGVGVVVFQSHLYGIESKVDEQVTGRILVSIAPLWN